MRSLMSVRRWRTMIAKMILYYQEPYFQGTGAQLAFYLIMSLVPLTVLFAQLCGVFAISPTMVNSLMEEYLSPRAIAMLGQVLPGIVTHSGSGAFSIVAVGLSLWSASKAQFCIVGISNYAYTGKVRVHSFVKERLRSILNVTLLLLIIVASLIVLVYGEIILGMVSLYAEQILRLPFSFNSIWYLVRWPAAIAVYVAVVSYVYYSSPIVKVRYRQVLPGSIAAACGMLIVSWGYSIYVTAFANFDALYGSLASIIALLFWFYILGTVFILGILFNLVWEETKNVI